MATMAADDAVVITAIVVARLAVPLLIPRIPLTLLAVLVAEILPSVHLSALDIVLGVVALVAANLAIATRGVHVVLRLGINFLLIYAGSLVLSDRGTLPVATGLFFAYLTTLIVVLYDAYRAATARPARGPRGRGARRR